MNERQYRFQRAPSLFWPIILIGAGIIWLMFNAGMLTVNPWLVLWRFWPVLLIVAGVEILAGRGWMRSILSALLGILVVGGAIGALLLAEVNPAWLNSYGASDLALSRAGLHNQHLADPLGGAKQADVSLSFRDGEYTVGALGDSPNLLEGDVSYFDSFKHDVSTQNDHATVELSESGISFIPFAREGDEWNLRFNPSVAYSFTFNTGGGTQNLDLTGLRLDSVVLDMGSGTTELRLPATGQYNVIVNGGSGTAALYLPDNFPARVEYRAGSGSFNPGKLQKVSGGSDNSSYETAGFSQSGPYVKIIINGGSGSIGIR